MTLYNDELVHYGVKGMKWGRRKSDNSGGSGGGIRKKIADRDANIKKEREASDAKDKKVYADLEAKKITRREAGKKFSEIAKEHPNASKYTSKEMLTQAGISTAIAATTLAGLKARSDRAELKSYRDKEANFNRRSERSHKDMLGLNLAEQKQGRPGYNYVISEDGRAAITDKKKWK